MDAQNPWRADFPILAQKVKGKSLAYLDNAATTQKPRAVIERVSDFLGKENANIHRGVYYLSMNATDAYDRARAKVATFLGAASAKEIVFVRGATEGIYLVAASFAAGRVGEGDEILVTVMEHHANFVPWQRLCEEKGAKLVVAPIFDSGEVDLEAFEALLGERTKMAAFVHVSNALGTVTPVAKMVAMARARGAATLVDGAQAVAHGPVNVRELGCDFYVFSGHKVFGPYGVGALYGRGELLEAMPPYQCGGDMIERVSVEGTTFRGAPERFEAGTPNISGAIGLAAALEYLEGCGWEAIAEREEALLKYASAKIAEVPGVRLVGTAAKKAGVVSFVMEGVHPHDVGTILDVEGVCVRAGHHCTMPLMTRLGLAGTARASLAFYNVYEDVDRLVEGLNKVRKMFG